jgi:excisionase family DNA binding protein
MEPTPPEVAEAQLTEEPLVGAVELARILDISERGARKLAESGRIPFYRVGGVYKFRPRDVLEALRREPTATERTA